MIIFHFVPQNVVFDTSKLQDGLNDLQSNLDFFSTQLQNVDLGRNVVVWFSVGLAILASILCCVYVHWNSGCLFEIFCSAVLLILLGCCVLIPVMNVVQNMSDDCCNEFYYQDGLLSLWESKLDLNIANLDANIFLPQISNDANDGCNYIYELCQQGACCTNMCPSCTANNITNFINYTINDNGINRSLNSCATVCTNSLLKNLSSNAVQQIEFVEYWVGFRNTVYLTLTPLQDPSLRTNLQDLSCNISPFIGLIYTGSGLLIGGSIIATILCLLLRGRRKGNKGDEEDSKL